jgi:hypothetical protein
MAGGLSQECVSFLDEGYERIPENPQGFIRNPTMNSPSDSSVPLPYFDTTKPRELAQERLRETMNGIAGFLPARQASAQPWQAGFRRNAFRSF